MDGFSLRFLLRSGRGHPRGQNGERQLALGARLASLFPIQVDGEDDSLGFCRAPQRPGRTSRITVFFQAGGCQLCLLEYKLA